MANPIIDEKALRYMEYTNKEMNIRHHTREDALHPFDLLKVGDPKAVDEHMKFLFFSNLPGKLSDDPVRHYKYQTVVAATLACRTAIEAGVASERAFNISNLYIQKMDLMQTVDELKTLNREMFEFYVKEIAALGKKRTLSRPVAQCVDLIRDHLYRPISVTELAGAVGLSPSYLSTLFKRETGVTITGYAMEKKIEAARDMLKYSAYSCVEIGSILAFSSQSHFIRTFKKYVGMTPRVYREKNYRKVAVR